MKKNSSQRKERRKYRRSFSSNRKRFRVHPLFLLVGVWYAVKGELFLFFVSALVAVQHELAHAFAAARLGYQLHSVVLMPFGAVIDGDLRGISFKDEIYVAFCGPLCNLLTALFFTALWWFVPTMYAFTDVACYASVSIALVNLLPAYPLDGGRILQCALARTFAKKQSASHAEKRASAFCRTLTFLFAALLLTAFILQCAQKSPNFTLLTFGLFLLLGGLGNRDKAAVYERIQFSRPLAMKRGVEIRRVAVLSSCPIKDVFRFLSNDGYLILDVYNEKEEKMGTFSQNQLSDLFALAPTPYTPLAHFFSPNFAQKETNCPRKLDFF